VAAGHPPAQLLAAVDAAGAAYQASQVDLELLATEVLAPGGRLAGEKTFTRADVVVAVAPHLHGLPPALLDEAVTTVLGHAEAVRLPLVTGSREEAWAARCVLADESRIAELAERLAGGGGPKVADDEARGAVTAVEERIGAVLTDAQREVAMGLLTAGHRFDVVVGVAGSGKTTTLAGVRAGFEAAGYEVVGTATSGQAARNLGQGTGMESRTVASLAWRLEHGGLALSDRHVVVLDEGGMTPDVDLVRLLTAVERSGAKLVVVGDDRQLGAVGPGGALRALAERHPAHVFTLGDNLRQRDRAERAALAELRDGDVRAAVSWYAHRGRVHAVPDRRHAVRAMVRAWAKDVDAGRDSLLLAYRRENVEALNAAARQLWERAGRLTGPELVAAGGRTYRAGDRVVTLTPGPNGAWVTSEPARVTAVDPDAQSLTAVTLDGRHLRMGPDEIGADRLAHGYAITAHRSQGATVDAAHLLDDGGGRELAYVAMSRARQASHVYTVGGDLRDAAERLAWSWDQERRDQWASDRQRTAERIEALQAERRQLVATVPPDVSVRLARVRQQLVWLERDLADLQAGSGRWRTTPVGDAHSQLVRARAAHREALRRAEAPSHGILGRRRARHDVETSLATVQEFERALRLASEQHASGLYEQHARLAHEVRQLEGRQQARAAFIDASPEVVERIVELGRAVEIERTAERRSRAAAGARPHIPRSGVGYDPLVAPAPSRLSGPDL
jgi:hypothetical protein